MRRLAVLLASIACLLLVASAARAGTCALPPEAGPVSAYEGTIRRALHTGEAVHVVLDCTPEAAGQCGALNRELNGYLQCRLGEARRAAAQPTATGRPSDPSHTGPEHRPVLGAGPLFELPPAPLTGSGPIPSGPEAAVLMPGAGDDPDQLPFTGSDGLLLVAGGLLLVVGGTLLVAARRLPPLSWAIGASVSGHVFRLFFRTWSNSPIASYSSVYGYIAAPLPDVDSCPADR